MCSARFNFLASVNTDVLHARRQTYDTGKSTQNTLEQLTEYRWEHRENLREVDNQSHF